jgi:hypothetical protein
MGPDAAAAGGSSPKFSVGLETAIWIGDGAPDPMDFGLILELLEFRVRFSRGIGAIQSGSLAPVAARSLSRTANLSNESACSCLKPGRPAAG